VTKCYQTLNPRLRNTARSR